MSAGFFAAVLPIFPNNGFLGFAGVAPATTFPVRVSNPQFVQSTAPSTIPALHCGHCDFIAGAAGGSGGATKSYMSFGPSLLAASGGSGGGCAAGVRRLTAAPAATLRMTGAATAARALAGSCTVRNSVFPQAGHLPFFPADAAGAFSFFPHEQTT